MSRDGPFVDLDDIIDGLHDPKVPVFAVFRGTHLHVYIFVFEVVSFICNKTAMIQSKY